MKSVNPSLENLAGWHSLDERRNRSTSPAGARLEVGLVAGVLKLMLYNYKWRMYRVRHLIGSHPRRLVLQLCEVEMLPHQRGRLTSVETPKRRFHGRLRSPPPSDESRWPTCAAGRPRCLACVLRLRSRCFRSTRSSVGVRGRSIVRVVFFVSNSPATSHC